MSPRVLFRLSFAAALAAAATPAAAQVAADTVELEELTVSATRVPVSANAVTASVTVVTGDELRERGIVFVADALRELPSATVVQGGGFGGVSALFLRGGESDYVKVLVDGVPVNEAGGAFNFANLSTANVDRIEIVRGPVSVLYGSDAVTGLVQIFTRRGAGPASLTASIEGGTDATAHWDLSAAGGSGAVSWSAGASRLTSDGMYDFNSGYGNTVLSARVGLAPGAPTSLAASARYTDARAEFPTDFTGVPSDSNQFSSQRQLALGAEGARFFSDRVEGRVSLSLARSETGFDDQPDHPGDDTGYYRSERETDGTRAAVDARVNVRPVPALVVTAGGQFEHEAEDVAGITESDFGGGPTITPTSFATDRRTAALYAQAVADLAAGLAVTVNGRIDDNSAFGTFLTGRAGVAYRVGAGTRLRGSLGSAYKAPTFCEQFCREPFIVGDSTLSPERVTSWEVGAEQALARGRVTVAATWFHQDFDDRIEYVVPADPAAPNYVNLTAARARGLELSAAASPLAGLRLDAGYTWLDTEITDDGGDPLFPEGERLVRRPEHTVSLRASYAAAGLGSVSLGVVRVGERDDYDYPSGGALAALPAYTTVDAAVAAEVVRGGGALPALTVTLRAENLFDAEYEQTFGFPGRGRMLYAGVRAGL